MFDVNKIIVLKKKPNTIDVPNFDYIGLFVWSLVI